VVKGFTDFKAGDVIKATGVRLPLLENWNKAWVKSDFQRYFFNSAYITAITVFLVVILASMAAYVLGRFNFVGNKFILFAILSTMMIPGQLTIIPLFFQFLEIGDLLTAIVNPISHALGLGTWKISLQNNHFGLILLYITGGLPFTIFILTGFFRTLPTELREAALIDGASEFKAFWRVMLPLAKPGLATVAIFNFLGVWNEYFLAFVFLDKPELRTIPIGLANMFIAANYKSDFGLMFAGVAIMMIPTFAIYIMLQERLTKGITMGALKG